MTAGRRSSMVARVTDIGSGALAATLAASLVAAAWHDASQAFDVWYYHVPFAARLVGIVDATQYAFAGDNQARFEGFPLFGELLQGLLWRATGHIAATNLVALGSLFALVLFLRRLFAVPAPLAFLAFLAVPLVQTHATSSYVDLPANACVTMLLLCVLRAWTERAPPSPTFLGGSAALAAIGTNTKFQLVPIIAVASFALVVASLRRGRIEGDPTNRNGRRTAWRRALVLALAAPLVFTTPIKNLVCHGNPVWPVEFEVLGRSLPHVEEAYASSPLHLLGSRAPVRFARSVLEIDNRPIATHRRWSLDQWTPHDEPGYRMGGFFGAYVLINALALGGAVWRSRNRETVAAAILFAVVTAVASVVPQSHELRYYMHWMLVLVSLNLVLWWRQAGWAIGLVATCALAIVAWSTDAAYLYPSGSTFEELVAARVERAVIDSAAPGERLCIARPPFTFLYAPIFHVGHRSAPARYAVQEAASDADCSRARTP